MTAGARSRLLAVAAVALLAGAAARAAAPPPADFPSRRFDRPTQVDNPWFPLRPGTRLEYVGRTSEGARRIPHRIVDVVTDLVKVVGGVRTVVVWERDWSAGALVEAELIFFAQDDAGTVWQVGEYPEEYEDGRFVRAPAWLHGVRGARAGIAMLGRPTPGSPSYAQGFAPPPLSWNDRARVEAVDARVCVPYDCFDPVLATSEFNPGEPGVAQLKLYARGVGTVLVGWRGAADRDRETLALLDLRRLDASGRARAVAGALRLERHAYRVSRAVYGTTPPATRPAP